jgi:hypothetical protein
MAVLCLLLVLAAGCSVVGGSREPTWRGDGIGAEASASATPPPPDDARSLVRRIAITDADVERGGTIHLIPEGDTVAGQVTLDLCGVEFRSEASRVARHQVVVVAPNETVSVSNEVVAYDSTGHAAAAVAEWRAVAARCPRGTWLGSTVAGLPQLRYDALAERRERTLPVPDNSYTTMTLTARDSGQRGYFVAILQRNANVLDAIYLESLSPLTPAGTAVAVRLARITGRRLASLS